MHSLVLNLLDPDLLVLQVELVRDVSFIEPILLQLLTISAGDYALNLCLDHRLELV